MKLFKNIMLFAAAAVFASCETDVDTPQVGSPDNFVAPVIGQCSDVIVNADNSKDETVIFTWSAADFGLPVQVLYSVYLTNGSATTLLGTSSSTSYSVSKGDLNGAVINGLGANANETVSVAAYVTAQLNGSDVYEPIQSANSNTFSVTTFAAALKWLHLCGEFNAWTIASAPIFWETTGGSNIYECMVDFTLPADASPTMEGRSYFKVTAEQNWSGANWGYNYLTPSWPGGDTEQADSNLSLDIDEKCIAAISVNTTVMTIDLKYIGNKLGLIGDFNSWGADEFFTYDAATSTWKTAPVALVGGSGIKVRVDSDWATNWGTTGEASSAVAGGFELGAGADNITVPADGTYVAVLHANRTPYVLELVAQ
ncbi:MAG: SusE domain-containing protein [Bacteroides sp.]|nr:SusE domain-containing protein [Bacteroides sp.]